MWLPSHVNSAHANSDTLFLLLAWCELFGDFTPDTFQPRLYHTPAVVAELEVIAGRGMSNPRWEKHLVGIRNELFAGVEAESTFLTKLPAYRWSLERLVKIAIPAESTVVARTLGTFRSGYEQAAFDALRDATAALPKAKEEALAALQRIATIAIQVGRSSDECLALVTEERLRLNPAELAEQLIQFARPRPATYTCYFALRGETRIVQQIVRKAGFALVSGLQFLERTGDAVGDAVGVRMSVNAPVPHDAARQTMLSVRRAVDVFNFYRNEPTLSLDERCTVLDDQGARTRIPLGDLALRRLHPRQDAAAVTRNVLGAVAGEQRMDRLLNALEHCSLAQTSPILRVQLVNLWSAVECLSGASRASSILSQVTEVLVPIVIFQRTEKTLIYTAIQLAKLLENQPAEALGDGFPASCKLGKFIHPEELLVVLSRPENHPHILALIKFAAPNSLLCNRIFTLWKLFHQPGRLGRKLVSARQTLEWHLARIYRARNLIVHEGHELPHIPWLLDHLHYYFTAACGRVLDALQRHPDWGVEEALTWWRSRCDYQLEGLQAFPERLTVGDIFRHPKTSMALLRPWVPDISIPAVSPKSEEPKRDSPPASS